MQDLEFISGEFFDIEVPKEKQYLLKYFQTDLQVAFVRYYLVFGTIRNFVDHTGHYCSERMLHKLQSKYRRLTEAHAAAKSELTEENMDLLERLESGKYRLTGKRLS